MTFSIWDYIPLFGLFILLPIISHLSLPNKESSPITLVLRAIGRVVGESWIQIRNNSYPYEIPKNFNFITVALNYLNRRENFEHQKELKEHKEKVEREAREWQKSQEERPEPTILDDLGVAFAVLVFLSIGVFILIGFHEFIKEDPINLLYIAGFLLILLIYTQIMHFVERFRSELIPVGGSLNSWLNISPQNSEEYYTERTFIYKMAGEGHEGTHDESLVKKDKDLNLDPSNSLPLPPGITELTISSNPNALHSIEEDLRSTRKRYVVKTWISYVTILIVIITCGATILFFDRNIMAICLVGILMIIFVTIFHNFSTRKDREAQIASNLFSTYVIELKLNLKEAEKIRSKEKKQESRDKAWLTFRSGLNQLWLQERIEYQKKLGERWKKPENMYKIWWLIALAVGLVAGTVVYFLPNIPRAFQLPLAIGLLITVFILLKDPSRRYIRAFWAVFIAFVTSNSIPSLIFLLDLREKIPTIFIKTEYDKTTGFQNICMIVLLIVLILMDFNERRKT